jgi:arsenate reductase
LKPVTIYHNPRCGTSRNTLALIRHAGIEPEIIEYLKTPPTKDRLRELVHAMGVPVREAIRAKEARYAELGLGDLNGAKRSCSISWCRTRFSSTGRLS